MSGLVPFVKEVPEEPLALPLCEEVCNPNLPLNFQPLEL